MSQHRVEERALAVAEAVVVPVVDLETSLQYALENSGGINKKAAEGAIDITKRFNWDNITDQYVELFKKSK